ncbi:MAG: folate-binding protein [Deltaproteobacteria bacterium]|nr:folate-binding protein [Deltaproteobacteria bacterium]
MTLEAQLQAARSGAAAGPVEARGLLRVSGRDAQGFLHRMSTQDLQRLRPGEVAYAAFLEAKGHLVSDALVLRREEDLLLLAAAEAAEPLRAHLARYVLASKVAIEDLSRALACLPVLGPEGIARGASVAGATMLPDARRGVPAVDLLLPPDEATRARAALLAGGAADLSAEALEVLRIEGGVPRFGLDMDPGRLAIECGITGAAVHFEKGCYIGQEVVLRGTFRGQVQRGLVLLGLPAGAGPGTPLLAADQEVGKVTSAADAPGGRIGLGLLKRAHWPAGTRLLAAGGEAEVRRSLVEER